VTASSSGSPSSYTSVRALDQFGNSVQLKHAREAADRHGRLVVAAAGNDNTVVVVSLGNRPMVHSITLPTRDNNDEDDSHHLALCCTGVKGDANWLIAQVQEHVARIWERYNHHPYSPAIAHLVARLLGSFGGEDVDQEWQSSIRRESVEWARPFGIQTMILSTQDPFILMVEPSGRVLATTTKRKKDKKTSSWCAMGKESDVVQEKLSRTELGDDGASQLQEKLAQQLLETVVSRNDITEVMVEILTAVGIERTLLQYKNGEQISSSNVQI
jgi:20S proteasome alpha/beta subunit